MKIARVFPRQTSMSPTDKDCYFGEPDLFMPEYDEVYISVLFTWDLERAYFLKDQWQMVCDDVRVGGPALDAPGSTFVPGMYVKKGVTITSRGCPNFCPWCFVPKREGKLRQLPIAPGNIIQDNNLLACSKPHIKKVLEMLRHQKQISFNSGLDSRLLKSWFVEAIRGLNIEAIWLAMDYEGAELPLMRAVGKLSKYFSRKKLRCYVLIGYEGDTLDKAEARLCHAWEIGTIPFAMRYRTLAREWGNSFLSNDKEWGILTRNWTRPAIIRARMRNWNELQ